jgi:hypothetical protein
MTKNLGESDDMRAKRNRFIWQLGQLAAKMESNELNKSADLVDLQDNNEQLRLTQYKVQAGKIIIEAYQSGEFLGNGKLCKVLDYWDGIPYLESTYWSNVQCFESICWQWYGNRFDKRKKELGELCAYAHVIRLLMSELEHHNID